MQEFKNELLICRKCGKDNWVKASQFKTGAYQCAHCGQSAQLTQVVYPDKIMEAIPTAGRLVSLREPSESYPLSPGTHVIGVGQLADIQLERTLHDGECFISRRHCTIHISLDPRSGRLLYLIRDGADHPDGSWKPSLNGTFYRGNLLDIGDRIYLSDQDTINLGGEDLFRLEQWIIPDEVLEKHRVFERIKERGTV